MAKRYTDEFKKQIVEIVNSGKRPTDIVTEYNIARSSISKWAEEMKTTGSLRVEN